MVRTLPLSPNVPPNTFYSYSIILTGTKKIGKTSIAAQAPNSYCMECEPGNAKGLPIRQDDVATWKDAKEILELLQVQPDYCTTLIVDDLPSLFYLCHVAKCRELGIDSPWDMTHGKAFTIISKEFTDYIGRLQALPCGKIYTAHAEMQEFQLVDGKKYNRLEPKYPAEIERFVNKSIQMEGMLYLNEKSERVMTFKGSNLVRASCGIPDHFLNKERQILNYIPLGLSPEEGYKNLMLAWDNQLTVKNGEVFQTKQDEFKKVNKFVIGKDKK